MGTFHSARWISDGTGQTRAQRASGTYKYFLPTKLEHLNIKLNSDVSGDVSRAELALQKVDTSSKTLKSTEGIARLLLRAEAISSSYIEGLSIGAKRLLQEELRLKYNLNCKIDATAASVVGNINAMDRAIQQGLNDDIITTETITNIHKTLCKNTKIEQYGGIIRAEQNWIGGSSFNPLNAIYISPAPEHLDELLIDLCNFCNSKNISPVVKASIIHAQFEAIHPFADGNGRTGRALIHLILRNDNFIKNLVPPISLIMATNNEEYINGLTEFRSIDTNKEENNLDNLNNYISFFAWCCTKACEESQNFEDRAIKNETAWRKKLGSVRKNSALDKILSEFTGMPIFTINTAMQTINMSFDAVSDAVNRCLDAKIIKQSNNFKRNKVFEVPESLKQINWFERKLASPSGDTSIAQPKRPVPYIIK